MLCAAENAAIASLTEEGRRENYLFGQKNMRMSFHYNCTNLHLDGADYIHFHVYLFPLSLLPHPIHYPFSLSSTKYR